MGGLTKSLVLGVALVLPLAQSRAAQIDVVQTSADAPSIVFVTGEFDEADGERFLNVVVDLPDAIIVFSSPGGSLNAGLEIGRATRLKGFSTLVYQGHECTSACALAWLGGRARYMARASAIGFHAAYQLEESGPRERGTPNALVGAYLNWLGLTSKAISCITSAPPESMNWITPATAEECDIEVEPWTLEGEGLPQPRQPLLMAPPTPQRAIFYFQGTSGSDGTSFEGTVTWTEITRWNGSAIQAQISRESWAGRIVITIYPNGNNLTIGHTVEIFILDKFGTVPVQLISAFVLKPTEQARGVPLIGTLVPASAVYGGLWTIALSTDAQDSAKNIRLLKEGSWFDIPVLFSDQSRALITFEKGTTGEEIFDRVLTSWELAADQPTNIDKEPQYRTLPNGTIVKVR